MQLFRRSAYIHEQSRPFVVWHTHTAAGKLHWRHPLVGYLLGVLLVGLGLIIGLIEMQVLSPLTFPGVVLLVPVVIVALFWGVGPAIFAILLSILVLDYLYIPPFGMLSGYGWSGIVQLLTFVVAGSIVALLTSQREAARLKAQVAERDATLRARQLEATFEAMSDGVVVYDRQGNVLQTNAATRRLFGLDALPAQNEAETRLKLLSQAIQQNEQGHLVAEKQRPLSRLFRSEALTDGNSMDTLVKSADGRELMLNISGAPISDEQGSIERAVLIYRNVTERRRLEQQTTNALHAMLSLAEALVQLPAHSSQEKETENPFDVSTLPGQRVVELTNRVVESRHVTMLTVDAEEELVRPITSVGFTVEEEQQWRKQFSPSLPLSDYVGSPYLLPHLKSDEVLMLEGMSLPVHTPILPYYVRTVLVAPILVGDSLVGLLCVDDGSQEHKYTAHEITLTQTIARLAALMLERNRLQREHAESRDQAFALHEANRRMEEFLSVVCHELKTPLTVIKGNIQLAEQKMKRLVQSETSPSDDMARRLTPIQTLMERARSQISLQDRLVNDLLEVSRVQNDTFHLVKGQCNLVTLVQEAVEDQRQVAHARNIQVDVPGDQQVMVHADSDRLVQVITNYLTNALKYSPPDHPIKVSLTVDGQFAAVSIRDAGPGLSPLEQDAIWQRFYRVPGIQTHPNTNIVSGGLGVGLYLCRAIIERHSGQVGVESSPGTGSTFWFALPLIEEERGKKSQQ